LHEIECDHGCLHNLGREPRKGIVEHYVIILTARREYGVDVAGCGSARIVINPRPMTVFEIFEAICVKNIAFNIIAPALSLKPSSHSHG